MSDTTTIPKIFQTEIVPPTLLPESDEARALHQAQGRLLQSRKMLHAIDPASAEQIAEAKAAVARYEAEEREARAAHGAAVLAAKSK